MRNNITCLSNGDFKVEPLDKLIWAESDGLFWNSGNHNITKSGDFYICYIHNHTGRSSKFKTLREAKNWHEEKRWVL